MSLFKAQDKSKGKGRQSVKNDEMIDQLISFKQENDFTDQSSSRYTSYFTKFPLYSDSSIYNFEHQHSDFIIPTEQDQNYGRHSKKGEAQKADTVMNIEVEEPKKKKRCDGKDAIQNLCSKLFKIFGECFCKNFEKTNKKKQVQKLMLFLQEHKTKNGQLCVLFCYEYLLSSLTKNEYQNECLRQMGAKIIKYIQEKIDESQLKQMSERQGIKNKLGVICELVGKLFMNGFIEIDYNWVNQVCVPLFTRNQKNTLDKPMRQLIKLQNQRLALTQDYWASIQQKDIQIVSIYLNNSYELSE